MKTRFICYIILFRLAVPNAAKGEIIADTWGAVSNEVQMSIGLQGGDRILKTNADVKLVVQLKNFSETNFWSFINSRPTTDAGGGVHFEITTPSGKELSPNVTYLSISGSSLNIPPHKMTEFEFELSDIFKFDESGAYKIIAHKWIGLDKTKGWTVTSNPLLLSVAVTNSVPTNDLSIVKP